VRLKRLLLVLALVVLGSLLLFVGLAVSAVTTVKTTVSITSGEGTGFKGKVGSAKKRCRAGRRVTLYKKAEPGDGEDSVVGADRTNASGAWSIDGSFLTAVYYARVAAVLVHANGSTLRCSYAWTMPMHY
jgi:hypothetical protein